MGDNLPIVRLFNDSLVTALLPAYSEVDMRTLRLPPHRAAATLACLLAAAAGCHREIIGAGPPTLIGEGGGSPMQCNAVQDCQAHLTDCRAAVACQNSKCVFDNTPDGTPLDEQTEGDCVEVVCDGDGASKVLPAPTDIEDDANPCTIDTCNGTTPDHDLAASVPCYTGAPGTAGKGICQQGAQQCDAQGNPVDGCDGEVTPQKETCVSAFDEDCDGLANEEGEGCVCVPGSMQSCYTGPPSTKDVGVCHGGQQACNGDGLGFGACVGAVVPAVEDCEGADLDDDCDGKSNEEGPSCACGDGFVSTGEECDDGNPASTDACTVLCKNATCGDGFTHEGSEECDDGNASLADSCLPTCEQNPCGDGVLDPMTEECDDGGYITGDKCDPLCKGEQILRVTLGHHASCALLHDGRVKCWGLNQFGELGLGDVQNRGDQAGEMGDSLPAVELGSSAAVALSSGSVHACAVFAAGNLKCWGNNENGRLGLGDSKNRGDEPNEMGSALPFVELGAGQHVVSLAVGGSHSCALLDGGSVKCWGSNLLGELGLGNTTARGDNAGEMGDSLPGVDLGTSKTAVAIAAGGSHTCTILGDGSVKCWGRNGHGQLGLGSIENVGDALGEMGDSLPAIDLGAGKTAVGLAAGDLHTCALLNDGSVKCWGGNSGGRLGIGDTQNRGDEPGEMGDALATVALGTGKTAQAIAAGGFHTCALLNDGVVKCWGRAMGGNLGLGDAQNRGDVPGEMGDNLPAVDVGGGKKAVAIDTGTEHTCALLEDRSLKCWGRNSSGALGQGDATDRGDEPNEMGDNLPAVHLYSDFW